MKYIFSVLVLSVFFAHTALAESPTRFYRVTGPTGSVIVSLSAEGTLVWTNQTSAAGTNRIEASDANTSWNGYTQFPVTGRIMRAKIMSPQVPDGMVFIPPGLFNMGDSLNDWESTEEKPVHAVYLSGFYLSQYEITKALWDKVYNWALSNGYSFECVGYGKGTNHPVYYVYWCNAVKWCNARSEKEGLTPCYYTDSSLSTVFRTDCPDLANDYVNWTATGYRLPTEAEWEKAAGGGRDGRRFAWSDTDEIQHARANYYSMTLFAYDTSPSRGYHPSYSNGYEPYTSPVGSFAPNSYGLYDMTGNLWEYCWDSTDMDYNRYSGTTATNPHGPEEVSPMRVARGGSWYHASCTCRVSSRMFFFSDAYYEYAGFRVARSAP